ncbi:MAG: SRPBCC family protein [Cupriavidus necator]|uniref:SRPBCC family protein n=1 Tax=Cupriavidus sp. BIC8F TaxID=3079014 RepID=UPI002916CB72|nr:SRPBCC family protein [Cupriavidus sp. BIC8F]
MKLRFEHLVEINDPGNPQLDPLTPDQLWQGLVLRAESPELFVLGLDRAEVVGRGDNWIDRVLHFGEASIQDHVVFEPRRQVRYETAATAEHAGGTLTMAIETPGPGALLLRFVYDTTMPAVDASGDDRYAEIVKSAYHEADIDTVRKIREIADTGRLG